MGCTHSRQISHSKNTAADDITTRTTIGFSNVSNFSEAEGGEAQPRSPCFDSDPAMSAGWPRHAGYQMTGEGLGAPSSPLSGGISCCASSTGSEANPRRDPFPYAGGGDVHPATARAFHEDMSLAELADVAPLAHGGFCVVCSCVYRGQSAVLKVPRPRGGEGAVADLLMEISIYKKITERGGHANITRAFGAGFHSQEGEQIPFLVLERLDGGSLAKALERSRPHHDVWSDPTGRLPVALELADALAFLHNEAVPGGFILHR